MKKILLALTVILTLTAAYKQTFAQAPNWIWANGAGGTVGDDNGQSISTDANGNVYVTGFFGSDSLTFGTTTITNAGSNGSGNTDIFVIKYDANGNILWAQSAGGSADERANSISTDANGNVYVTGDFINSTITPFTFGTTTLTSAGGTDIFILKYDSNGNAVWAKSFGGTAYDYASSISTNVNGNMYMTGYFQSSTIIFGTTTLTNAGNQDMFIAKYDANGNVLWANSAGDVGNDYGYSVSTEVGGNLYVTGIFGYSITFGTTTLTTTAGNTDIFIVKYDSNGNTLWAKSSGGTTGMKNGYGISTDANGNAYVTGDFRSSSITFGITTLTNADASGNGSDIFIAKYDANGNAVWAKKAGGTNTNNAGDTGFGICTDTNGDVYVTGGFQCSSLTFGSTTLANSGSSNIFIAKYDNNGNALWAKRAGGTGYAWANSINTDANGNVLITGAFNSPSILFGSITLTQAFYNDIFIAKLGSSTGVENLENENNIVIYPNPFSSSTTLQTDNLLHNATLTVDNCFGQTVAQIKNISGQTVTFSRDNLASGLYFVRLMQDNKVIAIDKLVIADK